MDLARVKGNYVNPLIIMDPPSGQNDPIAIGLHDIGGIDYMLSQGLTGVGGAVSSAPLLVSRAKPAT